MNRYRNSEPEVSESIGKPAERSESAASQTVNDAELKGINTITDRIIGCAIEVHRVLRCGLFESLYRSALSIEFDSVGLSYEREARLPAIYKGHLLGHYRVDFIVEDAVILEVKSVERMNPVFDTQVLTYLRLKKKRVGLLINFNSTLLKHGIKRIIV